MRSVKHLASEGVISQDAAALHRELQRVRKTAAPGDTIVAHPPPGHADCTRWSAERLGSRVRLG